MSRRCRVTNIGLRCCLDFGKVAIIEVKKRAGLSSGGEIRRSRKCHSNAVLGCRLSLHFVLPVFEEQREAGGVATRLLVTAYGRCAVTGLGAVIGVHWAAGTNGWEHHALVISSWPTS